MRWLASLAVEVRIDKVCSECRSRSIGASKLLYLSVLKARLSHCRSDAWRESALCRATKRFSSSWKLTRSKTPKQGFVAVALARGTRAPLRVTWQGASARRGEFSILTLSWRSTEIKKVSAFVMRHVALACRGNCHFIATLVALDRNQEFQIFSQKPALERVFSARQNPAWKPLQSSASCEQQKSIYNVWLMTG